MKVVNIACRLFVLGLTLCSIHKAIGQTASKVNMKTMVAIDKKEYRFDELLNSISRQAGVVFSFSTKKIAADKKLKLQPGKQTLETILAQINSSTGLYFKVVGYHIIFLDKQPTLVKTDAAKGLSKNSDRNPPNSKTQIKAGEIKKTDPSSSASSSQNKQPSQKGYAAQDSSSYTTTSSEHLQQNDSVVGRPEVPSDSIHPKSFDSTRYDSIHATRIFDNSNTIDTLITTVDSSAASVEKEERIPSNLNWFIGAEFLKIINSGNTGTTWKASGVAVGIKLENTFSKRFSWTLGAHLNYLQGRFTYINVNGAVVDTSATDLASLPVLFGLKYYPINKFYVSFETGFFLKPVSISRTKLAIVPSLGVLLPLKNKNSIDLGVKYTYVARGFATLETPGFIAGGFGTFSLRAAYGIQGLTFNFSRNTNIRQKAGQNDQQSTLRTLAKFDFSMQGLGFTYEPRIHSKMTIDLSLGLGGGYEVSEDGILYKWDLTAPAAYFSITPKFYYNLEARAQKNKASIFNAGNYFGLRMKYVTRSIGENNGIYDALLMNLHWGIQRPIAERWSFAADIGGGYAVDATDLSNSFGTIYPAFDVKLTYIFSRKKRL
jgi:hypothetical protein